MKLGAALWDPAGGWDARLWRMWSLHTALAYTIVLATVLLLASLGLDVTRLAVDHRVLGALLIATTGALLYGCVLGGLQWRVLRERIPMALRQWVLACVVPALVSWAVVVLPAAIDADAAGEDLRVAYFLAVSQALALGPLIGLAQATALRPFTPRWGWWIPANIVSWLIVDGIFFIVSLIAGGFDFAHGRGSPTEAFVVLIATTPVSARWMLWVTAPGAMGGTSSARSDSRAP